MTVAGIDFSSHAVDIVLLDEDSDRATWHRVELSGQDAFERARDVRRGMLRLGGTFWDEVVAIGIEQPRGNHGVVHLARIQGAVLGRIPDWLLVQPWNPSEWRKAVGLPGNATKLDVFAFAHEHRAVMPTSWHPFAPLPEWPQDACDAYCIALATRQALQRKDEAA